MSHAAAEHRRVAGVFSDRVRGVTDWDAPAPVDGWVARDVVLHLVTWFPDFLSTGGVELPPGPSPADPVAAWQHQADAVQALLENPPAHTFAHPRIGELPLRDAVDRFYTGDVFLHTWDLARASGQDATLDREKCAAMLVAMEPLDEMLRASGHYGPRVEVPADASVQDRLIAFIGRDPR